MSETGKHRASEPWELADCEPRMWGVSIYCGPHLCSGWLGLTPEGATRAAEEEIERLDKETS